MSTMTDWQGEQIVKELREQRGLLTQIRDNLIAIRRNTLPAIHEIECEDMAPEEREGIC